MASSALEKYKASIRRRTAEDRRDSSLRMERFAHRGGMILGLIAAPWLTMGKKAGPVPYSGILGGVALLVDLLVFPEGVLWMFAVGAVEGLGAADIVGAVAQARINP